MVLRSPSVAATARLALLASLLFNASCGGSSTSTTVVGPSGGRCGVTVTGNMPSVPASGGTGNLTVATARECSWSARADAAWITLSGAEGQGPATLTYAVAPNSTAIQRRGSVVVSDQRLEIVQEAAPCVYDVAPRRVEVGASGGDISVAVTATEGCAWTARSNAGWLHDTGPAAGTGNGTVRSTAGANSGPARTGTMTIAGLTVTVAQAASSAPGPAPVPPAPPSPEPGPPPPPPPPPPTCTVVVSPTSGSAGSTGGEVRISVSAPNGCAWSASSSVPWITVADGGNGTGNGSVRLVVAANTGSAREGTVTVGGHSVTITQQAAPRPEPCSYSISPASRSVGRDAAEFTVDVRTGASCAWTSTTRQDWITVLEGASGTGNGRVRLRVAGNTGGARTGTVEIAGESFTVQQEGTACSYSIRPTWYDAGRGPDDIRVTVSAPPGCAWRATTEASWVTISEGRNGTGDGAVRLVIPANDGAPRTAIVTIAGLTFTLTQYGPQCTNTIQPTSRSIGSAAADLDVAVNAGAGCTWSAASDVAWIRIVEGTTGVGSGSVRLAVQANSGTAPRTGTVRIAGQTFTVQQESSSCADRIRPTYYDAGRGPDNIRINVTAAASCSWTVTNVPPWVTVAEGSTGSGDGVVRLLVEANFGPARSATIIIGGQSFSLTQEAR